MPKLSSTGNITKKILIILSIAFICLAALSTIVWLTIVPAVVKSKTFVNIVDKSLKNFVNLDLEIKNQKLKTSLKPTIIFSVDDLILKKEDKELVKLNNFSTSIDFKNILRRKIKLNSLKAKTLIVKADELMNLKFNTQKKEQKSKWALDYFNSDLSCENFEISYFQNSALMEIYMHNINLSKEKGYTSLQFDVEAYIKKDGKTYANINSSVQNKIKTLNKTLQIDDLPVDINSSKMKLFLEADLKNLLLNVKSDKFMLEDIFNLVNSDFIIPNGSNLLKPLTNPSGQVGFDVTFKNNKLSGDLKINNTKASLKDVTNIPLNIETGSIKILEDKIKFIDLKGYYGKNKENTIAIEGDIKDYYKTFDSNIVIDTIVTNEFFVSSVYSKG